MELLIDAHRPFLISLAQRKVRRSDYEQFYDNIQEAALGFLEGLLRFDHRPGVKVITYAGTFARRYLHRDFLDSSEVVRYPTRLYLKSAGVKRRRWWKRNVYFFYDALVHLRKRSMRDAGVGDLLYANPEEWLRDESSDVEEVLGEGEHAKIIPTLVRRLLLTLSARQRDVLRRRMKEETLEEIGQVYGLSRERIRQIEAQALSLLRNYTAVLRARWHERISFDEWVGRLANLPIKVDGREVRLIIENQSFAE
jgi:RNA polymerase primary sigma factor